MLMPIYILGLNVRYNCCVVSLCRQVLLCHHRHVSHPPHKYHSELRMTKQGTGRRRYRQRQGQRERWSERVQFLLFNAFSPIPLVMSLLALQFYCGGDTPAAANTAEMLTPVSVYSSRSYMVASRIVKPFAMRHSCPLSFGCHKKETRYRAGERIFSYTAARHQLFIYLLVWM